MTKTFSGCQPLTDVGWVSEFGRKIRKNIAGIEAAMLNNLANALIEPTNAKIRVLHRMAWGSPKPST